MKEPKTKQTLMNNEITEGTSDVVIPEGTVTVKEEYRSSLLSVTIPQSVKFITPLSFSKALSLRDVCFDGTIEDWCRISLAFSPMEYASHFYIKNSSGEYEEVTSLDISSGISSIGFQQFKGFRNIRSVNIHEGVTDIEAKAFEDCYSLSLISLPASLEHIGDDVFKNCNSLHFNEYQGGYYLGNKENPYLVLVRIKAGNITELKISSRTRFILDHAFADGKDLRSVTLPLSITHIGYAAFASCYSLHAVYYEGTADDWLKVNNEADFSLVSHIFMKDKKGNYQEVTSFKADNELSFIGPSQFLGFKSLVSVIIPSSVQYIDDSAFAGCRQLTSVTLPESLKGIEEDAFFNCTSLKQVLYCGNKEEWEKIKIGEVTTVFLRLIFIFSPVEA